MSEARRQGLLREDSSLISHVKVVLLFLLVNVGLESGLAPLQALLALLRLQVGRRLREVVRSFAGRFEAIRVQFVLHALVVGAWQQVHAVHLRV